MRRIAHSFFSWYNLLEAEKSEFFLPAEPGLFTREVLYKLIKADQE